MSKSSTPRYLGVGTASRKKAGTVIAALTKPIVCLGKQREGGNKMAQRERKTPPPSLTDQMLERHENPEPDYSKEPDSRLFLSTGCSHLNLLLSDNVNKGFPSGRISQMIGDSDTCKTVLGLHALTEACYNPKFTNYKKIHWDIEEAVTESLKDMFGPKLRDGVEFRSALNEKKEDRPPETIEEFHYQVMELMESGQPFIGVLDALDFLPSQADLDKNKEQWEAWKKGKPTPGTYQMAKQKYMKRLFSDIKGKIGQTDSILIIVSQTIDNIGSMFSSKTVAGGNAMEFASRIRFWLSKMEADKKNDRVIGRKIKIRVSKNHITGKLREGFLWVYSGMGVDDTKTNVDFLLTEKVWARVGGWIVPVGLYEGKFQMRDLLKKIEEDRKERLLKRLVQKRWDEIEAGLELGRRPRYE